jgi:hypothetical protein
MRDHMQKTGQTGESLGVSGTFREFYWRRERKAASREAAGYASKTKEERAFVRPFSFLHASFAPYTAARTTVLYSTSLGCILVSVKSPMNSSAKKEGQACRRRSKIENGTGEHA